MFLAYKFGLIKVTAKFRRIMTMMIFGYAIFAHQADQATAYFNSFARAWELLKEAGKEVYTQEDYEAVRLKTGFFYGAIYPNGCAWQIEFADERHDYDTYIGDVTLDGLTGEPLTVSAEPSNG